MRMSLQKALPVFGQKSPDSVNEALDLSNREKLKSIYSTQRDVHRIRLTRKLEEEEEEEEDYDAVSSRNQSEGELIGRRSVGRELKSNILVENSPIHYTDCLIDKKAVGVWIDELDVCILIRQRGVALQNCRNKFSLHLIKSTNDDDSSLHLDGLPIEETLYLAERASLIVFDNNSNGNLVPIETLYSFLDQCLPPCEYSDASKSIHKAKRKSKRKSRLPLSHYLCYSIIRRAGLSLTRKVPIAPDLSEIKNADQIWDIYDFFNPKRGKINGTKELQKKTKKASAVQESGVKESGVRKSRAKGSGVDNRIMKDYLIWTLRHPKVKSCARRELKEGNMTDEIVTLTRNRGQTDIPLYVVDPDSSVIQFLRCFGTESGEAIGRELEKDEPRESDNNNQQQNGTSSFSLLCFAGSSITAGPVSLERINDDYFASLHDSNTDCNRQ